MVRHPASNRSCGVGRKTEDVGGQTSSPVRIQRCSKSNRDRSSCSEIGKERKVSQPWCRREYSELDGAERGRSQEMTVAPDARHSIRFARGFGDSRLVISDRKVQKAFPFLTRSRDLRGRWNDSPDSAVSGCRGRTGEIAVAHLRLQVRVRAGKT